MRLRTDPESPALVCCYLKGKDQGRTWGGGGRFSAQPVGRLGSDRGDKHDTSGAGGPTVHKPGTRRAPQGSTAQRRAGRGCAGLPTPSQEPRGRDGGHTMSSGVSWFVNTHETPSGASRTPRGGSAGDRDACEQVGGQQGMAGTEAPLLTSPASESQEAW